MQLLFILICALIIELITCIFRFGFDLQSRIIQKKLKFPLRIHHLYLGIIIMVLGILFKIPIIVDFGFGISLSDLIHHFIVLPIAIKKTEFP